VLDRPVVEEQQDEIRLHVGAATDTGGRPDNEDAVYVGEVSSVDPLVAGVSAGYLLVVADGVGGHERGEVASQLAVETLRDAFASDPGADAALLMKQAFRRANARIFENGQAADGAPTMGTTLVAAMLRGKYATIASIGDSRAYLVRANRLTQVTKDHSLVAEQVAQGQMTQQEARESPHRNVLIHALGQRERLDNKMPSLFELTLLPEDRLLLCSDGFFDVITDDDFVQIVLDNEPEAAARRLIDLANERGATDNVSAVIAEALPTRVPAVLEPATVSTGGGMGSYLVPTLVALGAVLFIALVILALTLL
jgi:protein phosphatase